MASIQPRLFHLHMVRREVALLMLELDRMSKVAPTKFSQQRLNACRLDMQEVGERIDEELGEETQREK